MSDLIKSSIQFLEESTGQIDELSKATLGSYLKKASHNVATLGAVTRQLSNDARDAKANDDFTGYLKKSRQADKVFDRSWKRRKSMGAAIDRLTKEDLQDLVDNIDQLDEDQREALAQTILEETEYLKIAKKAEIASKAAAKKKHNPDLWNEAGRLHHMARVHANSIKNPPKHIDPNYHKDASEESYKIARSLLQNKSINIMDRTF